MNSLIAEILATLAVGGVVLACFGAWRSADALTAQHFVAAAGTVPVIVLAAAVVASQGFGSAAVLAILSALAVLFAGPATATAFGRALVGSEGPEQSEEGS